MRDFPLSGNTSPSGAVKRQEVRPAGVGTAARMMVPGSDSWPTEGDPVCAGIDRKKSLSSKGAVSHFKGQA